MKHSLMKNQEINMIQLEYGIKDGQKLVQRQAKEIIRIRSIKMCIIT